MINPLKVTIENYPDNLVEELEAINNPEDESMGTRKVPFSKTIYIEREDFMEDPPKNSSACRLVGKFVCAMPITSPAKR